MKREEALGLIKEHITKENLLKHMYAVEAIMKEAAEFLNEDVEKWRLVGLIHDIDFEKTESTPEKHTLVAAEILDRKIEDDIIRAIKAHNFENVGVQPESNAEKALIAADAISGLIIACALVMPSKKLADVKVESVAKKFKQKEFAKNCSRERILFCEQIGIPKEKFFEISLRALQSIASDLGL
jgi:putative nucleotidyltransferase with HDIG domain